MKAKRKTASKAKRRPGQLSRPATRPRPVPLWLQIEDEAESISRLAQAVWLIGQLLMESEQGFEVGPPLKQLAEEIQRYTKLAEGGLGATPQSA
jgi:hypothetical protein